MSKSLFGTGTVSTCETCGEEIYFSAVRDADDPWVHRNWTKQTYDHPATPTVGVVTVEVSTVMDPLLVADIIRRDERFLKVTARRKEDA